MKKEIYNLQIVRGLAALLVVFSHLVPREIQIFANAGEFGVAMFFFLSGLIMVETFKESDSPLAFIKKRILRIYPVYIVITLPLAIIFLFKNSSIPYFIHSISLVPWLDWNRGMPPVRAQDPLANPVAWTLCYEMYFYVIFSLCKLAFKTKKPTAISCSIILVVICLIVRCSLGTSNQLGFYNVSWKEISSNIIIIMFPIGMVSSLIFGSMKEINFNPLCLCSIPISMLSERAFYHFTGYNNPQILNLFSICIPASIFVLYLYKSSDAKGRAFRAFHSVGGYSYSLYLTHSYFLLASIYLMSKYSTLVSDLYSIISISLSIYISKKIFLNLEMPLSTWIKNKKLTPAI